MSIGLRPSLAGWLVRPLLGVEDAVRVAGDLVADGVAVALDVRGDDARAVLSALSPRLAAAGITAACEVTVQVGRVVPSSDTGLALALAGPPAAVDRLAGALPAARVVVDSAEPGAEDRCRALAGRRVRLLGRRGAARGLAFVRCLNVLMAGDGELAVATTDPRLIAITGERAAWNGRPIESWEHVMPWGSATGEQRRLLAAGHTVRVQVPVSGRRA